MDASEIALRQNIATNGRMIVALIAAANALAGHPFMVALCAVVVGFAYLADGLEIAGGAKPRVVFSLLSLILTVALLIATLVLVW